MWRPHDPPTLHRALLRGGGQHRPQRLAQPISAELEAARLLEHREQGPLRPISATKAQHSASPPFRAGSREGAPGHLSGHPVQTEDAHLASIGSQENFPPRTLALVGCGLRPAKLDRKPGGVDLP